MVVRVVAEEMEPDPAEGQFPPGVSQEDLEAAFAKLAQDMGLTAQPEAKPTPLERIVVKRAMPDKEILAAMAGLGAVLVVRLMLLLAVVGGFALAWQAMQSPTIPAIGLVSIWAVLFVGPLTWLSTKRA